MLATLAAWFKNQGRPVDGFLACARDRHNPQMGAARYDLEWVADIIPAIDPIRGFFMRPSHRLRNSAAAPLSRWISYLEL